MTNRATDLSTKDLPRTMTATRSPRPVRRLAAAALALTLALALAACGEKSSENADPTGVSAGGDLSSLTVKGDFGKEPTLTWDDAVTVDGTETDTLIEGDGDAVKAGDSVLAHVLVANGVDRQVTSSDFAAAPQLISLSGQILPVLSQSLEGQKEGSRVLIAAPASEAFGESGNPELGIGNRDTVIFVIDLDSILSVKPHGTKQKPAPWVPKIKETDGSPDALDFAGTPKPGDALQVATLIKGDGPAAKEGDEIYVHYLGQVYGGKKPFDSSWTKGAPMPVKLGGGQVIKGWDQGLVGVTVGSRVVLSIPPALGYGKKGNPQAGIKPTDTLYFVVDVLSAS